MTAQVHYCKSCAEARAGKPVPYQDLDPEMIELVRDLNSIPGFRTVDSCYGHPSTDHNFQSFSYVGFEIKHDGHDFELFRSFWEIFFDQYYGKIGMPTGYVQFSIVYYPFDPGGLVRLHIEVEHNAAINPKGDQEKKEAIQFLRSYIKMYLDTHSGGNTPS